MSDHRDQLNDLLGKLRDGELTEADAAALEQAILADPDAMDRYLHHRWIEAGLTERFGDRTVPVLDTNPKPDVSPPWANVRISDTSRPRPRPFTIPNSYTYAALVAIATIIVGLYVFTNSVDPKPDLVDPNSPGPAVATLIENTPGSNLRIPADYPVEGESSGAGEYSISGGTAEFMLTNAVNVKLRGETRMFMRNDMNVALTRGSAEFIVPKDATGFTVHLPDDSKIVDLGTAFSVKLDDEGEAQLRVRKGSVEWTPTGVDAEPLLIVAGQSARIVDGQRIVTFEPIEIAIANAGFEEASGDVGKGNFTNVTDWNEQSEVDVFVFKGGREWQPEADGVLYLNSTRGAVHQDVDHHWSPDDAYTIELVAFEAGFRVGTVGDAVRVQLRQADGTVLWDSGPVDLDDTLTGSPGNFAYTGSDHRHTWDIDASAFSSIADAVEGSGLNLRIAGIGGAVFVDDVALSVAIGGDAAPPESPQAPQAPEAVDTPDPTDLPQHTTEPIETSADNVSATSNEEE